MTSNTKLGLWGCWAVLVIIFIGKLGWLSSPNNSSSQSGAATSAAAPKTTAQKEQVEKENARDVFAALGAQQLRRAMRDPDSFKLTSVLVMETGSVCYKYRARNGFNGLNAGQAVLSAKGKFKTDEMDGFSTLWNRECANKTGNERAYVVSFALDHSSE